MPSFALYESSSAAIKLNKAISIYGAMFAITINGREKRSSHLSKFALK
jgi:hypothetical protein